MGRGGWEGAGGCGDGAGVVPPREGPQEGI